MTLYRPGEAVAAFVARMRAEHGLAPKVADEAILGRIAAELHQGDDVHALELVDTPPGRGHGDGQQ